MKSKNIRYLPELDHLRGYSAVLLMLFHGVFLISPQLNSGAPAWTEVWPRAESFPGAIIMEGYTVISLLMVISGFIFTFGAYGEEVNYWRFLRNRALRIYPLLLLLLFVGMYSFPERFDLTKIFTILLTLENVHHAPLYRPFTSIFWSIYVDLQFYLLFPFLLSILNRRGIKVLVGMVGVVLVFRLLALLEGAPIRDLTHFTIVGRLDQILIGMIAAVVYRNHFVAGKLWDALFVGCSALLCLGIWLANQAGGWGGLGGWRIVLPTIEAVLWAGIALGYFSAARFLPPAFSRFVGGIGVISYSSYLLHMTIIDVAWKTGFYRQLPGFSPQESACLLTGLYVVPAVLALSVLTYHFIEKPFLELRGPYKLSKAPALSVDDTPAAVLPERTAVARAETRT